MLMRKLSTKTRAKSLSRGIAGLSFILLGACSAQQIGDIAGADLTKSASGALAVIMGTSLPDNPGDNGARLDARSPLVLPPDRNLQAPVDKERDTTLLTSQWPDDPDERALREAEEAERLASIRDIKEETRSPVSIRGTEPLSLEELAAGRIERDPNYSSAEEVTSRQLASRAMSPEELLNRRGGSPPSNEPPGPPVRDAASEGFQIPTAPSPAPATERELVVPPNMQAAPPGGTDYTSEERPSIWRRMQFWRKES